ncbi:N-glycosylase/DNA lyase [Thermosipho atlanticus]|uniref:N-glycosylase/DNA lyase n=1 Tax=Thermosipho atlanticus TaxID=238991 RepID=UPI00093366DF|nr:N-glycosylase/DNA lyase [Thermosipho atlanticus]
MKNVGELIEEIKRIYSNAKEEVEKRWAEFENLGKNGTEEELFIELSFCILTANWTAKDGIKAQKEIKDGFLTLNLEELENALRKVGHRFPKARSKYIYENRWILGKLKEIVSNDTNDARVFLVNNIKGIGWKESSHFLRNVGKCDVAILDKHVLRLLKKYDLIKEIPKSWNKNRYLSIEKIFKQVAQEFGECPGKFDLYLWYYLKGVVEK